MNTRTLSDFTEFHGCKLCSAQLPLLNSNFVYSGNPLNNFTWLSNRYLKVTIPKTELLILPSKLVLSTTFLFSTEGNYILIVTQVKILGIIVDSFLSSTPHIQNASKLYWLYPQNITRIWPLLTSFTDTTLVPFCITPSMDFFFPLLPYCLFSTQ